MPVKNFNTKADFDSAYYHNGEPEGHPNTRAAIRVGYSRATQLPWCRKKARKLIELFSWHPTTKILVVGAGYGWTIECLEREHNFTNIVGIDTSDWIQANMSTDEEVDIREAIIRVGLDPDTGEGLTKRNRHRGEVRNQTIRSIMNEDILTERSRLNVTGILGGNFDVAISEAVIASLEDSEVLNLSIAMHLIASTVIHADTMKHLEPGNQDEGYNWKFIEDWVQLLPNDTIINFEDFIIG